MTYNWLADLGLGAGLLYSLGKNHELEKKINEIQKKLDNIYVVPNIVVVNINGVAVAVDNVSRQLIISDKDHTKVILNALQRSSNGYKIVLLGDFEIGNIEIDKQVEIEIIGEIKHKTGKGPLFTIKTLNVKIRGGKINGNADAVAESDHSIYNCAFKIEGSPTEYVKNIVIENVEITNFEGHSIVIEYGENIKITRNYIHDTSSKYYGMDGVAIHYGKNIVVSENVFENIWSNDSYGGGVEILASSDAQNMVEDVTISKNTFKHIGEFAIGVTFADNPYQDYPHRIVISENTIIDCGHGIIVRSGRGISIRGNTLLGTEYTGIEVREHTRGFNIIGNIVHGNCLKGIYVVGIKDNISGEEEERGLIANNEVYYCSEEGIRVEYTERVMVIGNTVSNCAIGIDLYGWQFYTSVIGNVVQKNIYDGIHGVYIGKLVIVNNIVVDNGDYGINIEDHNTVVIKNNVCLNNSSGAINITTGADDIVADNIT